VGVQPVVAERIGTAARSKAPVMLPGSWLLASRIAAGACQAHCNSRAKRRTGLQKLQKRQLGGSSEQKWPTQVAV